MQKIRRSKIKYLDLWGLRKDKYKFLETHNVKNTKWQNLELKEPHYWFVPKDTTGEKKYQKFISVKDIFNQYTSGVETKRDDLVIDFDKYSLKNRISTFVRMEERENFIRETFGLSEKSDLDVKKAQDNLKNIDFEKDIIKYNYRPFDVRWLFYNKNLVSRTRKPLMSNLQRDNLAINLVRLLKVNHKFNHVIVSDKPTDRILLSNTTSEASYVFPLYVYGGDQQASFKVLDSGMPNANFSRAFWDKIKDTFIEAMSPLDLFHYIYGVLYSDIYRKKYNEFLKIDFPKIPFTKNDALFYEVSEIGKELCNLHLLKSQKLNKLIAKFPVSTGNIITDGRVKKREYVAKEKRIYINDEQYFEKIEPEIWNYYIGGYQVLDKWLKDRITKVLSPEDIDHYLKIITAIKHTIDLQQQIDKIYPKIEKNLITPD